MARTYGVFSLTRPRLWNMSTEYWHYLDQRFSPNVQVALVYVEIRIRMMRIVQHDSGASLMGLRSNFTARHSTHHACKESSLRQHLLMPCLCKRPHPRKAATSVFLAQRNRLFKSSRAHHVQHLVPQVHNIHENQLH